MINFFFLWGQLELVRAKLARSIEENQRLRELLSDATHKYESMHDYFVKLLQERDSKSQKVGFFFFHIYNFICNRQSKSQIAGILQSFRHSI